jgi:ferric-dicitrate binding protein FerR (iron transport regulator)
VRTAADSDARFVLRDDTNLSLGPGSTLKLDRTVFSDDASAGDIAIKLTNGAFRFVSGNSKKEAYVITTPVATMGVRGTTLKATPASTAPVPQPAHRVAGAVSPRCQRSMPTVMLRHINWAMEAVFVISFA